MDETAEVRPLLDGNTNTSEETIKPTWRQRLIFVGVFFIGFSVGVCSYVLSEWTHHMVLKDYFPDTSYKKNTTCGEPNNKMDPDYIKYETVQQVTATWSLRYSLAAYIPMFCVQLVMQSYSDVLGRKFLLITTCLSVWIKVFVLTMTIQFNATPWCIVGVNILEGMMGGVFGLFATIYAYIADITRGEKMRSREIVILDIVALTAAILASLSAGHMNEAKNIGYGYTALFALCLCSAGLFVIFLLPESLPKENRAESRHVISNVKRIFEFYWSDYFAGKRTAYILLLLAYVFLSISGMNRSTMEIIYLLGAPFCWGAKKIGYFMLIRQIGQAVVGFGSVPLLQKCMTGAAISVLSMTSTVISLFLEAFARSEAVIYLVPVAGVFNFLSVPMIRTMMSAMTSKERQGALFASIALLEILSTIVSSLSENIVYSLSLHFMKGFVFLIAALVSMLSLFMLLAHWYRNRYYNLNETEAKKLVQSDD